MRRIVRGVTALLLFFCMLVPVHALTVDQALGLLDEYYIDEVPDRIRSAQTVEELLALLGDPYTTYMSAEAYAEFLNTINNTSLVGIGVSIEEAEEGVLIVGILDDSPALEAGLAAGDTILEVDGTPLTGTDHARTLLGGTAGTPVTLTVRQADGSTVTLGLTRREILIPVTMSSSIVNDGDACLIRCTSFGESTPQEFADLMDKHDSEVNAWLIDLSRNPGGISQSGAAAVGCFVGGGTMLYFRDGEDNYSYTYTLPGTVKHTEKPAIILAGPYTASASELFMAAMRDHRAGISLGLRTFGKGVAQYAFDSSSDPDLFNGDAMKITVFRFFSPNGVTNDKLGVFPTLMTSLDKTYGAALLLCSAEPEDPAGYLNIALADWDFYVDLEQAMSEDYRPCFVELLEALPPYAGLWKDGGGRWKKTTVDDVVRELGLSEYRKRSFSDLDGCPQAEAIQTLCTYGLVSGYGDGTFHPDARLTRAEFCAMMGSILGLDLPPVRQSRFTDVDAGAWYAPVVHAMQDQGLLSGYGDGTFRPESPISQEEIVSILASAAVRLNMRVYNIRQATLTDEESADFAAFSTWARKSAWLLNELTVELNDLAPQQPASRGLAAEMVCRLLTQGGLLWK